MTRFVYRSVNGLAHISMSDASGWFHIGCEKRGLNVVSAIWRDPMPQGTLVTCVPCLAALMERG